MVAEGAAGERSRRPAGYIPLPDRFMTAPIPLSRLTDYHRQINVGFRQKTKRLLIALA